MSDKKLSEKAYIILEDLLVTLKLEPGKTYSEKELIEITGISRTPLREALLKLSHQAIINIIPRHGIEISDINMSNQLAILETRKVLDNLLISRAARYATPLEKEKILECKDLINEAVKNNDILEYMKLDKELDNVVYTAGRNEFAYNATAPLHLRSRRFWYYFKGLEDLQSSAQVHTDLIDAIIASNESLALELSNKINDNLVEVVKKYVNL